MVRTLLIILTLTALPNGFIFAHPIDEIDGAKVYDQKQILTIGTQTTLRIDLTIYAIEKNRIWESIDRDKNQSISDEEKNTWMNLGKSSSFLTDSAGLTIAFVPTHLTFPSYFDYFSRPPAAISIEFKTPGALLPGLYIYHYEGKDKKLSESSIEIQGASDIKRLSDTQMSFVLPGQNNKNSTELMATSTSRINQFLSAYVKRDELPSWVLAWSLVVSFIIGMLHAMTPGHGKAIVASYLIGSHGTWRNAVQLALIITITHTASVFLLGIATLLLTEYFVPTEVVKILDKVSGMLIVLCGLFLLWKRIAIARHGHDHHDHDHEAIPVSWKNLIPLGISGGIVPCIDALAILIVAVTLNKLMLGLVLLIAFSLGLATTLTGAGLIVIVAKDHVKKRWTGITSYEQYISIASALIVTLLGFAMLWGVYV